MSEVQSLKWLREKAGECIWFGDDGGLISDPPRNKYGRTKREAERVCRAQNDTSVLILRAPRFFCEDVLPTTTTQVKERMSLPQLMASELLGRRAALSDIITAHVKGLLLIEKLNGKVLTLAAPWPWSREETPGVAAEVAQLARERFSDYRWPLPKTITRVYDSTAARKELEWKPKWCFDRIVDEFDSDNVQLGLY